MAVAAAFVDDKQQEDQTMAHWHIEDVVHVHANDDDLDVDVMRAAARIKNEEWYLQLRGRMGRLDV